MIFILSLIIILILISTRSEEKGKITTEEWMEGVRVILIMVGVILFGLVLVYLMETYYFK